MSRRPPTQVASVQRSQVGDKANLRSSDPGMAKQMHAIQQRVSQDRDFALKLLRDAGIATPSGRLSKSFGG